MTRGRRPGTSTTRGALLEAARRQFAEAGYDGASLRAIAAEAGVDPALAVHYFGSKENLFREAVGWPFDPAEVVRRITGPGPGSPGERRVRAFLDLWEEPATRDALLAVLRSAMTHEESATLLRRFLQAQLLEQLGGAFEMELVASQLIGLALARYVLKIEPIASASPEELVRRIAPTLDRYLTT